MKSTLIFTLSSVKQRSHYFSCSYDNLPMILRRGKIDVFFCNMVGKNGSVGRDFFFFFFFFHHQLTYLVVIKELKSLF